MEELKLHDPYPLWYDARPFLLSAVLVGIIVLGLVVYVAFCLYRKYKKEKKYTPYESALMQLKKLNGQEPRVWYTQMSAIIKNFLHALYALPTSLTDHEIALHIEQLPLNIDHKVLLVQFFKHATQGKFAAENAAVQDELVPQIQEVLRGIWDKWIQQKRRQ